ncbi:hypothetical protein PACTADRAFT_47517 [Pachysolen tannophilus NRRL Y-2460]|uniref:Major facilitator superfamily (MFS) profile domain-containing protein n=1 Tax=Pachysolen tannophilus NRRL Y-2460 TaxID=669874 RepID=A0A1E4U0U2_PACTA|nr:hypothetical protein PACTADRAFT_47517 [Pachysolen tannophilus NRRL Y-2460]
MTTNGEFIPLETIDKPDEEQNDEEVAEEDQVPIGYPCKILYEGHEVILNSGDFRDSREVKIQVIIINLVYLVFGLSDATVGTIIPSITKHYEINNSIASYLFASQFVGYTIASVCNEYSHRVSGFYGTLLLAELNCFLCYFVCFFEPPFWVMVMVYMLNGLGLGSIDACTNVWIGNLSYHNQIMGITHSNYGLGCMISPILIIYLLEMQISWNNYYAFLFGMSGLTCILIFCFFSKESKWKYLYQLKQAEIQNPSLNANPSLASVFTNKLVWFFSFVLFIHVGGELAFGSWIYNYFITIKHQTPSISSYITSAYWLCMTLGRIISGLVMGRWHENNEMRFLLILCFIISLSTLGFTLFDKVSVVLQIISVLLVGFSIGPMFPTTVIIALSYLPENMQISGVGLLVAVGGSGAAVLPYLIGFISKNGEGLRFFPFVCFVIFTVNTFCWSVFRYFKKDQTCEASYQAVGTN